MTSITRALKILDREGAPGPVSAAYNNLAAALHLQGEFDRALDAFAHALRAARLGNAVHLEAMILLGEADLFSDLGLTFQAGELYEQGLALATQIDRSDLVAHCARHGWECGAPRGDDLLGKQTCFPTWVGLPGWRTVRTGVGARHTDRPVRPGGLWLPANRRAAPPLWHAVHRGGVVEAGGRRRRARRDLHRTQPRTGGARSTGYASQGHA